MVHKLICMFVVVFQFTTNGFAQEQRINQEKAGLVSDYIALYRNYLSDQRGGNCQMFPSCSHYGEEAMTKQPLFIGMINTSDRLLRCSHDFGFYQNISTKDGFRSVDTLNDTLIQYADKQTFFYVDTTQYMNKEMLFIQYLMNNNYFQSALIEIQRIRFLSSDHTDELWVYINLIRCLNALDKEESVIREFFSYFPNKIRNNPSVVLEVCQSLINLDNFHQATIYLDELKLNPEENKLLYSKYLLYRSYVAANNGDFKQAVDYAKANDYGTYYSLVSDYNMRQFDHIDELRTKKPWLAGVLGIVPGGGYLYSGHQGSAISALIINGLLFYATYTSIESENYGLAALTGIFSFSFYIGNITGGIKSAKRFNTQQRRSITDQIQITN